MERLPLLFQLGDQSTDPFNGRWFTYSAGDISIPSYLLIDLKATVTHTITPQIMPSGH